MALTSFLCQCGTPLAAAIGTPSVTCHVCKTVVGVPIGPPPPPPPPAPIATRLALPPGPRTFASIVAIASMFLFVLYLAVGLQFLGLFGAAARLSGEIGQVISVAGIVGVLVAAAGVYESILAFRGGVVALIACGVFHTLAGVTLLSLDDRHGLGALIGSFLGGPLAHVHNIGMLAIVTAGACIAGGIVVRNARTAQRRAPPPHGQPLVPQVTAHMPAVLPSADAMMPSSIPPPPVRARIDRRTAMIAGGAAAAIAIAVVAVIVLKSSGKKAAPTVDIDDFAYGYEGGCRDNDRVENRGDPCRAGTWTPVTYMGGGTQLMSGPCWSVCSPGEHARPIDMTRVVAGSIRCLPGTHYQRGLGSCQVTFKRRIPKQEYDDMAASMAGEGEGFEGDDGEAYLDENGDEVGGTGRAMGASTEPVKVVADVKPEPTGVHGTWSGSASQDHGGYISSYSVEIEMFSSLEVFGETSRPCGTIRLASLGCAGILRCNAGVSDARAEAFMSLTEGVSNCVEGTVTLETTSPDLVSFRWHGEPAGRYPDGVGTLSRVR